MKRTEKIGVTTVALALIAGSCWLAMRNVMKAVRLLEEVWDDACEDRAAEGSDPSGQVHA